MLAPIILMLAQADAPPAAQGRWSILTDPCAKASGDMTKDVIVCGRRDQIPPRLPLPQFRGPPDHAVPSNPDMTGAAALNGPGIGNECGAYGENCEPFGGGYVIPKLANAAMTAVSRAFAKHYPKQGRQAIDLDAPPPAGKLEP